MDLGGETMKVMTYTFLVLLVICLPVTAILAAENAVCRAPDFYSYEFTKVQASKNIEGDISENELGEFFSDFMLGKTEDFLYLSYDKEEEREPFTKQEGQFMKSFRSLLDVSAVVLAATLAFSTAASIFLIRRHEKEKLRLALKCSLGAFGILWIILVPLILQADVPSFFKADSFLSLTITSDVIGAWVFAGVVSSAIALGILLSVLWKFSRPKRMFW